MNVEAKSSQYEQVTSNKLVAKGEKWLWDKSGGGINIYTPLCIKYITNKCPLHSAGGYTQYFVTTSGEKNLIMWKLRVVNLMAGCSSK